MRRHFLYLAILFLGIMLPETGFCQKKRAEKEAALAAEFEKTAALVESNRFTAEIERVYSQRGGDLTRFNPRGKIAVANDSVTGNLPFFGRAYQLPYGDGGGIEFSDLMKEKKVTVKEKKKQNTIQYSFSVPGKGDVYRIQMDISGNGNCTIYLTSNNREHISYSGKISAPEKK